VIAFGTIVTDNEAHARFAGPTLDAVAEPDSELYAWAPAGDICRGYNLLLEHAARREDLEALVLVHTYTELLDRDLCGKLRAAFADPDVGVVGVAGASAPPSLAWWEGEVRCPSATVRYQKHGGGEVPAFSWTGPDPGPGEVDVVDGFLIAVSPRVARTVRFDEGLIFGHGFDFDFCLQAREAGHKVVVADIRTAFNRSLEMRENWDLWTLAHAQLAEKWEGRMLPAPADAEEWRQRARRAEAEREAARALAHSNLLGSDARVLMLERELDEVLGTASWRITEPLRRANAWRNSLGVNGRARA
jgi:hypothetical protein